MKAPTIPARKDASVAMIAMCCWKPRIDQDLRQPDLKRCVDGQVHPQREPDDERAKAYALPGTVAAAVARSSACRGFVRPATSRVASGSSMRDRCEPRIRAASLRLAAAVHQIFERFRHQRRKRCRPAAAQVRLRPIARPASRMAEARRSRLRRRKADRTTDRNR